MTRKLSILCLMMMLALFASNVSFTYAADNGNNGYGNNSGINESTGAVNQAGNTNNGGCNNTTSNNNGAGNNHCGDTSGYADGGNVPEVPYAAVLPVGLLAVLVFLYRKRAASVAIDK